MTARLSLTDVAAGYRGRRVVGPVSAEGLGGVVGLLGPNGSGKSTLVKAVARMLPSDGDVALSSTTGADTMGYLPQDLPGAVSLTVLESVLVAARRGQGWRLGSEELDHALGVLDELGLAGFADRYLGEMSGGQRQLVGLAQVLVREPVAMLLDEPTSALDLHHQVDALRLVRRRVAAVDGVAVLVLHDLNLAAAFCDELLVLQEGALVARGTPAEVLTPALLADVYGVEAHVLRDGDRLVVAPVV